MDDREIIRLYFERSEQAIRETDRKYRKLLFQLSFHILNNREDTEECISDTYLGAWNAIPPADPSPLSAFLCKIARNISLKLFYRKRAQKRSSVCDIDRCQRTFPDHRKLSGYASTGKPGNLSATLLVF